jgi:osmoprotectant transport system substrate-binding protein
MNGRVLAILAVALPAALGACGGGNSSNSSNSSSASGAASNCPAPSTSGSGNGAAVSIGSKAFAEEQLLASITQQVLQAHGFNVTYTFQAADKAIGTALDNGTIDMYWQYTGTELGTYLNLPNGSFPTDLHQAFTFVQQKDASRGICWYAETPFNDTNGIAIKTSDTGTYGKTLGDFGKYLTAHPSTSVCIMSEFRTRPDGLPGLQSKYGWPGTAHYIDIQNTAEKPIANGQCVAGEVFTTDSAIQANKLTVLEDTNKLFPPDNAGLLIRQQVAQKYPLIAGLMNPVAAKLTTETMVSLNEKVEIENQKFSDVAHAWLVENGFLKS